MPQNSVLPVPARRLALIAIVLVTAGLTGCGVRGSLEAPKAEGAAPKDTAQADSGQGKKQGEAPKPHQGFILDGLLR